MAGAASRIAGTSEAQPAPNVVESTTPQIDVSRLTPEQLMQAAALAEQRRQAEAERADEEAERQYLSSPQGQLEAKLARSLPRFEVFGVQLGQERGGFWNSQFDIEGLPASLLHCWVPIEDLHQWRRYWRPMEPEDVSMFEGEMQQGKVFVRSFDIKNRLVVYRDMVLMVADKVSIENKTAHSVDQYNDRFRQRAPDGKSFRPMQVEGGDLTVLSESYAFDSNRIKDAGV